ncbi:MAG: shikimate kinase [Oscillospiraceae bacterium]|nr:shikimate kinase [Oscillospiraceae bacterium]
MKEILLEHFRRYPHMQAQDIFKLLHQSEYGGGHLVRDSASALQRLRAECEASPPDAKNRFEEIGSGLCRLYLAREMALSPETVNAAFVADANTPRGCAQGMEEKFRQVLELCRAGSAAVSEKELLPAWERYRLAGFPAVSHSEEYRRRYRPSYRVMSLDMKRFFPVFCAVDRLLKENGRVLVAIDGCSGSGKSHLGQRLSQVYGCAVFHMDDYFLQNSQRTAQRLAEPGGNIDYERFEEEVIRGVAAGGPVAFRRFDCATRTLQPWQSVSPSPLTVLEGVYSQHPRWRERLDLKILLRVAPQTQRERILQRNGAAMLRRFEEEWIPLENRYFVACDLAGGSDLILDTD